jgi:predicted dehydrogenase
MYVPYVRQEEPLKIECQHFLDCIRNGTRPLSDGEQGRQLVLLLEASSTSLRRGGAAVTIVDTKERRVKAPNGKASRAEVLAR